MTFWRDRLARRIAQSALTFQGALIACVHVPCQRPIRRTRLTCQTRSWLQNLQERTFLPRIQVPTLLFICTWQRFLEFSIPWDFGVLFWSDSRSHLPEQPLPTVEAFRPFLLWAGLPEAPHPGHTQNDPWLISPHSSPGLTFSVSGLSRGCPPSWDKC